MKLHVWRPYVCSNCHMSSSACPSILMATCPCLRCGPHSLAIITLLASSAMYDQPEVVITREQAQRGFAMWAASCKGQPPKAFVYICLTVLVPVLLCLRNRAKAMPFAVFHILQCCLLSAFSAGRVYEVCFNTFLSYISSSAATLQTGYVCSLSSVFHHSISAVTLQQVLLFC